MHKETKRAYGLTGLGVGVTFSLAIFAHWSLLFVAVPSFVAAAGFPTSYHRDQIKEHKEKEKIDHFIEWGQGLLNDAPETDAGQADVDDWQTYHKKWTSDTWAYL